MDKNVSLAGLALAAAALFLAGAPAVAEDSGNLVKVRCYGANACKGQAITLARDKTAARGRAS